MQRYGVMRIYGRKAGDDHGRLEKPMLIVWLVAGIAYIGGYVDLQRLVHKLGIGGTNARSVRLLGELAAYGPGPVLGRRRSPGSSWPRGGGRPSADSAPRPAVPSTGMRSARPGS